MSSHIDCDDLLALATCSVEDQFNSDIKNQLSMSLLRHIAQAGASGHTSSPTHPYGFSNNHRMFAPATTPTTSSYTRPTSTWMGPVMEEPSSFSTHHHHHHHHDPRGGRTGLSRSAHYHEEEDDMETDDAPSTTTTFSVILPEGDSASGKTSGTRHPFDVLPYTPNTFSQQQSAFSPLHPTTQQQPSFVIEPSSPPSLFATSDPFFLAVSELQSVAACRRQLQPKTFAAATPLQVTPNPVQVGASSAAANGMFMRREGQPFDTAMLQYR